MRGQVQGSARRPTGALSLLEMLVLSTLCLPGPGAPKRVHWLLTWWDPALGRGTGLADGKGGVPPAVSKLSPCSRPRGVRGGQGPRALLSSVEPGDLPSGSSCGSGAAKSALEGVSRQQKFLHCSQVEE